jgi:serine protease Do
MKLLRPRLFHLILAVSVLAGPSFAHGDEGKSTAPPVPNKAQDKPLPAAFSKTNPESIDDLKAIENHIKEVVKKLLPCTVCIQARGSGSGVIVSEDGLVLTAGHVSSKPRQPITIITPDGKRHKGITLGGNETIDSGMVKITDPGKWPYVEMGMLADLKKNDWCLTTGHPGGFKSGRSPVVRVGRILDINDKVAAKYIRTDCTLVGGDSGGPLFDMHGRVIGIHSRIGGSITANFHVPVDTYRETWDRLVKGDRWGNGIGRPVRPTRGEPYLGFKLNTSDKNCTISEVVEDSPAAKAGLKAGDVIKKFNGQQATTAAALFEAVRKTKPGDEVTFEIQRGKETMTLKINVGRRPGA